MVSDRDHDSRHPEQFEWTAFIQHGTVTRQPDGRYRIAFGEVDSVSSQSAFNNRSLELSEAVVYGDKLLVMCDVSGTVYELDLASKTLSFFSQHMFTAHGLTKKPFKVEWATVKDGDLILGSIGKEWVHRRQVTGYGPTFIKRIHPDPDRGMLKVVDEDWGPQFQRLRVATNTTFPGYLLHEAMEWDPLNRRWIVLPRRVSAIMYDPDDDELAGGNLLIIASEDFSDIQVHTVGSIEPEWGFTSLSILPGTNASHFLVAKAQEHAGVTSTKIAVIDSLGNFLLDTTHHPSGWAFPTLLPSTKYEGIALLY